MATLKDIDRGLNKRVKEVTDEIASVRVLRECNCTVNVDNSPLFYFKIVLFC